jgi:hypothetical protein
MGGTVKYLDFCQDSRTPNRILAEILVTKEHTRWYKVNFKEERAREVVNRGAEVSIM